MPDPASPGSLKPLLRIIGTGLGAFAIALVGALIGANLWPRVIKIEQRVVTPAIRAVNVPRGIESFPDLIASACPAIVAIDAPTSEHDLPLGGKNKSGESRKHYVPGFLISADGYLLSSIQQPSVSDSIHILLNDGRILDGKWIGRDSITGLAVLKIQGGDLPYLQFADADMPRIGQWAIALAAPNGTGCIAAPEMIGADFVARGEKGAMLVHTASPLDQEFDGGPLLGQDGRVLAVVAFRFDPTKHERKALLASNTASRMATALIRGDNDTAPTVSFGFAVQDLSPTSAARIGAVDDQGAIISLVEPASPASRAGLEAGDIIRSIDGSPVGSASELMRAFDKPNSKHALGIERHSNNSTIVVQTS